MKYKDTTEEQRKSITPYLKDLFEENIAANKIRDILSMPILHRGIMTYQQAQKAEIEYLEYIKDSQCWKSAKLRLVKLKFESELE